MKTVLFRLLPFGLATFFLFSSSLLFAEEKKDAVIAAKVNGKVITVDEIYFFAKLSILKAKEQGIKVTPEFRRNTWLQWVDQMIIRELMLQKAAQHDVRVPDGELETATKAMMHQGIPMDEGKLKEVLRATIMVNTIVDREVISKIVISDKDLEDYYKANKADFDSPEKIKLSHIFIETVASQSQIQQDAIKKKAEETLVRAKEGTKSFAELAKELSDSGITARGGLLGAFKKGEMPPHFEDATEGLKEGELSPVTSSKFGFHILRVDKIVQAGITPFEDMKEEVRGRIKKEKGGEKVDEWVTKLMKKAIIERFETSMPEK